MEIRGVGNSADYNMNREVNSQEMGSRKAGQMSKSSQSSHPAREDKGIGEGELIKSIESANEQFIAYNRRFEFSIHEKTKHIMVKIIDVVTDEVVREIPPEKILDMVAGIWELSGILVDERI